MGGLICGHDLALWGYEFCDPTRWLKEDRIYNCGWRGGPVLCMSGWRRDPRCIGTLGVEVVTSAYDLEWHMYFCKSPHSACQKFLSIVQDLLFRRARQPCLYTAASQHRSRAHCTSKMSSLLLASTAPLCHAMMWFRD